MTALNIAIIGECMVELQNADSGLKQAFGGDTLNTALYLSRLTKSLGVRTSYVTALGRDPFSLSMLTAWNGEGIDTSLVVPLEDKMPGLYYIETDASGERSFYYWRSDSAAKYLLDQAQSQTLLSELMTYDAVYLSGISLAILTETGRHTLFQFIEQFKAKGGKVIFDNNYRPKLWKSQDEAAATYRQILSYTDIALLTFDDDVDLFGDKHVEQCIERSQKAGIKEIIIKRGGEACLVVEGDNSQPVAPTVVDNIVDTTAAGDSFSAGYLAKRLTGSSAVESAKAAHCMAGAVIQHPGAIIPKSAMPEI